MSLRRLLTAPEYPGDPERTALARLFHLGALVMLAALFAVVLNNVLAAEFHIAAAAVALMAAIGALIAAALRGRLGLASAALSPVLFAVFVSIALIRDGVHDSAMVGLAATIVVAGVLMKWRALLAFVALVLAAFLAMGYAEMAGLLQNRFAGLTSVRHLVGVCLGFAFIAVVVRTLSNTMIGSLGEARSMQERLDLAIKASRASRWEWDIDRRMMHFDKSWTETLGFGVAGNSQTLQQLRDIIHPEDLDALAKAQLACLKGDTIDYAHEARVRNRAGAWVWVLGQGKVVERSPDGRARRMAGIVLDVTDRRRAEALLNNIARGVGTQTGEAFFREVVLSLCRELPADMAFVGEVTPPGDRIRTVACCRDGELTENFDYPLAGSPCAGVIGRRGTVVYPAGVARLFPEDLALTRRAVEGYGGTSLIDAKGNAVGILVALTRKPIERKEFFTSLLEIFAARAAGEIERARAEERIRQLATRDALTGLPNRLLFTDRLSLAISNAQRHHSVIALLFIDLDRFKNINDSLGHGVGDVFLKRVAERLSQITRTGDTLARLGGDEFVVLLENLDPAEDAAGQVARKILGCFSDPFQVEGHTLSCACSIGISLYPSDATDAPALIRDADTAMYHVKESGRGSYRYFSAEMNARAQERLHIENGLREALALGQFETAYQPKVGVASGKITGFEALLRWHHPVLGAVPPARFISVAEDSGLIVGIGGWVLQDVCRRIRGWGERGLPLRPVAVNLSVRQFTSALIADVSSVLREFRVDPGLIEFEITESSFARNPEEIGEILKGLASVGTRVAIDDFGTGYSSLGHIKHFSADALKIDRSFISDLTAGPRGVAIVRAIITMARGLKMRVIAEGVETREQLRMLEELHCDEYQGYLFSRPLLASELEQNHLEAA